MSKRRIIMRSAMRLIITAHTLMKRATCPTGGQKKTLKPSRNFPQWYEAFNVTEKDQMYIAPEKRIIIW